MILGFLGGFFLNGLIKDVKWMEGAYSNKLIKCDKKNFQVIEIPDIEEQCWEEKKFLKFLPSLEIVSCENQIKEGKYYQTTCLKLKRLFVTTIIKTKEQLKKPAIFSAYLDLYNKWITHIKENVPDSEIEINIKLDL